MNLFTWFTQGSTRNQRAEQYRRNIAGERVTLEWHETAKKHTMVWIAERKALAAAKRTELSPGACYWFDQSENEEINRLEHSIQWNEKYITHARNNIQFYQHRLNQ